MAKWQLFVFMVFFLFSFPSESQDSMEPRDFPFKNSKSTAPVTIKKVLDATTLYATNDSLYRLDGLRVPDQFLPDNLESPIHDKALSLMQENFGDKNIRLFIDRKISDYPTNRFNHKLGQIIREDNKLWAQKFLLENGLAIAWPSPYTTTIWPLLLKAEKVGRESKLGVWNKEDPIIKSVDDVSEDPYTLQLVEGKIVNLATVRNNLYLNFGQNWRTDFTVMIPVSLRQEFSRKGQNIKSWQGKTIRVRGFVEEYNGPMIKIMYADQIELLPDPNDNNDQQDQSKNKMRL